jgi:hypothetical protein
MGKLGGDCITWYQIRKLAISPSSEIDKGKLGRSTPDFEDPSTTPLRRPVAKDKTKLKIKSTTDVVTVFLHILPSPVLFLHL